MPKRKDVLTINFIAKRNLGKLKLKEILDWVFTAGKILVFITFGILVAALTYRYSLDLQIEKLTDGIELNVREIGKYGNFEYKFRHLILKLDEAGDIIEGERHITPILRDLEDSLPLSTKLTNITITENSMSIEGSCPNEIIFTSMLLVLKENKKFYEIVVDEIISGGVSRPEVEFVMKIRFDQY
jgi:hypothetical protein